jgi:hypothetical protein
MTVAATATEVPSGLLPIDELIASIAADPGRISPICLLFRLPERASSTMPLYCASPYR